MREENLMVCAEKSLEIHTCAFCWLGWTPGKLISASKFGSLSGWRYDGIASDSISVPMSASKASSSEWYNQNEDPIRVEINDPMNSLCMNWM